MVSGSAASGSRPRLCAPGLELPPGGAVGAAGAVAAGAGGVDRGAAGQLLELGGAAGAVGHAERAEQAWSAGSGRSGGAAAVARAGARGGGLAPRPARAARSQAAPGSDRDRQSGSGRRESVMARVYTTSVLRPQSRIIGRNLFCPGLTGS